MIATVEVHESVADVGIGGQDWSVVMVVSLMPEMQAR